MSLIRSLEKLVDEPEISSVRLGEYAGDESLEADEGDGGPCCFQGVEPGGDSVCGTICLTTCDFDIEGVGKKYSIPKATGNMEEEVCM